MLYLACLFLKFHSRKYVLNRCYLLLLIIFHSIFIFYILSGKYCVVKIGIYLFIIWIKFLQFCSFWSNLRHVSRSSSKGLIKDSFLQNLLLHIIQWIKNAVMLMLCFIIISFMIYVSRLSSSLVMDKGTCKIMFMSRFCYRTALKHYRINLSNKH